MAQRSSPVTFRSVTRLSVGRDQILNLIEITLEPLVLVLSQWAVALWIEGRLRAEELILSLIVFSLTFPGSPRLTMPPWRAVRHILLGWLVLSGLLFFLGYATRYLGDFDRDVLLTWWWVALLSLIGAHFLLRAAAPAILELQGPARRVVLAGMNEQGIELAQRLAKDLYINVRLLGFFDDRARERRKHSDEYPLLCWVRFPICPSMSRNIIST